MSRESAQAFWSYVHADDEAERGLIVGLARALRAEYELITGGGRLELYVDRDDIAWGSNWRGELDRAVRAAGFFVPIITPRYFLSTECRLELDYFQSRAKAAGALKLLLPIYYASVPELDHSEKPADPAMRAIHDIHREDWRAIRFQDPSWPHYREAVNRMAARIAQVVKDLTARLGDLEPRRWWQTPPMTSSSSLLQRMPTRSAPTPPAICVDGSRRPTSWPTS